jgi:hypothetical protein
LKMAVLGVGQGLERWFLDRVGLRPDVRDPRRVIQT